MNRIYPALNVKSLILSFYHSRMNQMYIKLIHFVMSNTRSMKCIHGDYGLFRSLPWKPRQRHPSSLALLQWQSTSWMSMTTCPSSQIPASKRVYWKPLQGAPVSPKYKYIVSATDVMHSLSNSFILKHNIFLWFCQKIPVNF